MSVRALHETVIYYIWYASDRPNRSWCWGRHARVPEAAQSVETHYAFRLTAVDEQPQQYQGSFKCLQLDDIKALSAMRENSASHKLDGTHSLQGSQILKLRPQLDS